MNQPALRVVPPSLHEQRLEQAVGVLRARGARRVLDLGCGSGALLYRLLQEPCFEELVGLECSGESLVQARANLARYLCEAPARLRLLCGSYADRRQPLGGFDAAVMLETIEHVEPRALSAVETSVFGHYRPRALYMTTPNREYNVLLGLARDERRDPDHRFEWDRGRFRAWARGVGVRHGYQVAFGAVGDWHPELGTPTQTALFTLAPAERSASADLAAVSP